MRSGEAAARWIPACCEVDESERVMTTDGEADEDGCCSGMKGHTGAFCLRWSAPGVVARVMEAMEMDDVTMEWVWVSAQGRGLRGLLGVAAQDGG
ncbi:hypothetical protein MRB53_023515 [Persea americana]|uniref:Uncharacterized protein n=1 Tax=Persea americana TaxID=3435 RepID=A0ACC2L9L0_PERAE|nr:hypothetical protein MRB53_023515 [Persea americana]